MACQNVPPNITNTKLNTFFTQVGCFEISQLRCCESNSNCFASYTNANNSHDVESNLTRHLSAYINKSW